MEALSLERRIEGDGTTEATWHAWPTLRTLDALALDQWLPVQSRLVVVAPHPDDEILCCGGLLRMHADRGGGVFVVAVTDGEASHGEIGSASVRRLASARRVEREVGLARLGLRDIVITRLGLPDGAVHRHAASLATRLQKLLQPSDLAITTWRLDGHPDHEATGAATARACAARHCRHAEAPVWMWHWAWPDDTRVPWDRLRRLPLTPEARMRKAHALAAHHTQLAPRGERVGPVLGKGVLERLERHDEYLFV